jgi:hypothetical protein
MRKVREVLRLRWQFGLSQRQVASACGMVRSTVGEYLERAERVLCPRPSDRRVRCSIPGDSGFRRFGSLRGRRNDTP